MVTRYDIYQLPWSGFVPKLNTLQVFNVHHDPTWELTLTLNPDPNPNSNLILIENQLIMMIER